MTKKRKQKLKAERRRVLVAVVLAVGVAAVAVASVSEGGPPPEAAAPAVTLPEGRIWVEILNGGGVTGMARRATGVLREVGFDVVEFGNARPYDPERPSAVIDRVGRSELARAVADALGIDNVLSDPDPNLYVDVTVLLGSEWSPAVGDAEPAGPDERGWWDPRGWAER